MNQGSKQNSIKVPDTVEIFGIVFPRITQSELLERMHQKLIHRNGAAVCFPDMSTMNLITADSDLQQIVANNFEAYNDGAGLALAARSKGKPFPDNLNGTDFIPAFLNIAPKGSRVFLLGGREQILSAALEKLKEEFSHIKFVGSHNGYFEPEDVPDVVDIVRYANPDIVLVAMGNPQQLIFINECRNHPCFEHVLFFAVGGLLHYFAGDLTRAPKLIRSLRLEWLFIVLQQPHKFRRYFFGIPRFFINLIIRW